MSAGDLIGECITCEAGAGVEGECPVSERDCGHHCNHSWTHEECCWCGTTTADEQ